MPYRDAPPSYRGGTLRDVANSGDRYADILYRGANAQSAAALQSGDAWSNAIGGLGNIATDYFKRREVKKADEAIRTATAPEYPSATKPVPGSASDVPDPATDHMQQILSRVSPEQRPRVEKSISEFQAAAKKAKDAEAVAMQHKKDAIATGAYHAKDFFDSANGGLGAVNVLVHQAKAAGFDVGQYEQFVNQANEGWAQSQSDPGKVEVFKKAFQQQAGPLLDQLTMGASPEVMEKFKPKAKPELKTATVPGPDGLPMLKSVTPEELAAGVPTYVAPEKPEKLTGEDAFIRNKYGPKPTPEQQLRGRAEFAAAGREPKGGGEPKLVQMDTVGPDGKAATTFVVPKEGATYAKPTGQGKPATGQQRKALNFFNRGKEAQDIATAMEEGGNVNAAKVKYIPDIGNFLLSNPEQAYKQAQRAFTEARLRKESGAAIAKSEYDKDALTYFKQPNDSPETIAQKRAGRNAILAGIAFESGDALKEFYGDESEGMLAGYKQGSKSSSLRPMTSHGQFSVKAPDGKTYRFGSAAELDGFKKRAGIK